MKQRRIKQKKERELRDAAEHLKVGGEVGVKQELLMRGGISLPFCRKCGVELKEDTKFCSSCGTPVGAEKRVRPRKMYAKEREACFGPPGSGGGLWGAMSFGVFIVGLGILWFFDIFWPGILILIGIMAIIGALVTLARR